MTGEFIEKKLDEMDIKNEFIKIQDDTRINVKLKCEKETEINASGPKISSKEREEFLQKIESLNSDDVLILSGSVPKSLGDNFYKEIIEIVHKKGVRFSIDTASKEVFDILKYHPILIKPNLDELKLMFDIKQDISVKDIVELGRKLIDKGAQAVIISMGAKGSIYVSRDNSFMAKPISGKLVSSVGSGDSMVGAYVYARQNNESELNSYKLAVAASVATAFNEDIANRNEIYEILNRVEVVDAN